MKQIIVVLLLSCSIFIGCSEKSDETIANSKKSTTLDQMIEQAKTQVIEIKSKDFMALMEEGESFVLIDVRTKGEHDAGYIPGAVNIPRGVLEFRIASEAVWDNLGMYMPEKNEQLIIYCKKGHRGVLSALTLKQLGYTNVKNLTGGWLDWLTNFPDWTEKNEVSGAALPAAGGGGGC